jgi:hypothetical protein
MFAGHVGAALIVGRAERRVNVGVFVFAALLLDVVLWILVLLGAEHVTIPPDFALTHQARFDFPYSHGLLAGGAWSVAMAILVYCLLPFPDGRVRAAALMALAVFSHWALDAAVHVPEMPLAGPTSPKLGLGLWQRLPIGLALEALVVGVGLALFLAGSRLSRRRTMALVVLCVLLLAFTIAGMTLAPPPPSAFAMAASSLATMLAACALFLWIGRAAAPLVHGATSKGDPPS